MEENTQRCRFDDGARFCYRAHFVLLAIIETLSLQAPIAEEWAFRACLVPALMPLCCYDTSVAWIAPMFFAVAHFHHVIQVRYATIY